MGISLIRSSLALLSPIMWTSPQYPVMTHMAQECLVIGAELNYDSLHCKWFAEKYYRILFFYCTLLHYHAPMHCNLNSAKRREYRFWPKCWLHQVLAAKKHQPQSPKSIRNSPSRQTQSCKHKMLNLKCKKSNLKREFGSTKSNTLWHNR